MSNHPSKQKHLYNMCTMLDKRRRRWADVVQMFCVCWDYYTTHAILDVYLIYILYNI